ncbi:hypothetical protein [Streptomyces sp. NPDC090025]|uniref:hypothetical protein n=1 Tax=Streptomyces sp. NPDC090025 TaxID=3365922 RepID=UPI003834824D
MTAASTAAMTCSVIVPVNGVGPVAAFLRGGGDEFDLESVAGFEVGGVLVVADGVRVVASL